MAEGRNWALFCRPLSPSQGFKKLTLAESKFQSKYKSYDLIHFDESQHLLDKLEPLTLSRHRIFFKSHLIKVNIILHCYLLMNF